MPARPSLLLFDMDGVLANYDRAARCRWLAEAAASEAQIVHEALFGEPALEARSDRGELDLDALLQALREQHGLELSQQDFLEARRRSTGVDPQMLQLCQALAGEADLAVFTNNGAWVGEHAAHIAPELARIFGSRFICAGQLRRSKPDPGAYRDCLALLGAEPRDTLFIDDRGDNVEGARAAGLSARQFEGEPALRMHLRDLGFLGGAGDEA